MHNELNRRQFLQRTVAGGGLLVAGLGGLAHGESPNNRVVVGVVGMNRGRYVAETFAKQPNCTVKYVCDTDSENLEAGRAMVAAVDGQDPEAVGDLRQVFDDPEVDAVAFALPVHWHAPATIMACQAGKHVYVEKPCCHNPWEGERMIEAARKYNRVVQMGTQRRSYPIMREAIQRIHEGLIGRTYFVRSWYANTRGSIGRGQEASVPDRLNYDLWQGPAPRRPYMSNVVHYNWHWFWHWGTGELGNNGVHFLDLCRWGLDVDYPTSVNIAGGRHRYDDDQETPDTQLVSFDYDEGKTITWEGLSCNVPSSDGTGVGAMFYGEEGSVTVGSNSYVVRDERGQVVEEQEGHASDDYHVNNFLEAVRQDDPGMLHLDIEEGYKSTLMCLLGNISYRTGRSLRCGDGGHILDDAEAQALWRREYEPGWEPTV